MIERRCAGRRRAGRAAAVPVVVPGAVAVFGYNWAVNRGRCTMSSRKPVTALRFSGGTPNSCNPSCTRVHRADPFIMAGRNRA